MFVFMVSVSERVLEIDCCPRVGEGQLLYGPIMLCPAGEQRPGEKVKQKSTERIHLFPERHAVPKLLLEVYC